MRYFILYRWVWDDYTKTKRVVKVLIYRFQLEIDTVSERTVLAFLELHYNNDAVYMNATSLNTCVSVIAGSSIASYRFDS